MKMIFLMALVALISSAIAQCHYSCSTCLTSDYYTCTACQPNRGDNGIPVSGMCYCDNSSDED